MLSLSELEAVLDTVATAYTGYPPSKAKLPYMVQRPLIVDPEELAVSGDAIGWDTQISVYCCAAGVEASFNMAIAVMKAVQGYHLAGSTLSTSLGYVGAQVEGHYETQVTIQVHQGGI